MEEIIINGNIITEDNVNKGGMFGYTPLHWAIYNNIKIVKLLLQHHNIDVNIKDKDGDTPLHLAVNYNDIEKVVLLLQYKNIDVNVKNEFGNTPLHLAVRENNTKIVKLLLKHPSIDVNIQNNDENTPLHLSVQYKNIEVVKLLLEHPDIYKSFGIKNKYNQRPIDIAKENNYLEIIELFKNYIPPSPIFFQDIY